MKAYFDRDGRKTNTINIPQSENGICKKNGMDFCIDAKCSECETKKMGVEYRTIQFLIPVHEVSIDTGSYAKWSEWDITPKDKMPLEDMVTIPRAEYEALKAGGSYLIPKEKQEELKTIASLLVDGSKMLLTWCGE